MTASEAIKWLKGIDKKYIHGGDEGFDNSRKVAISTAISALEKQIPKKAVVDRYPWAICPVCGGSVYLFNVQEHIYNCETTYCEHCGQALDWSDTE